MTTQTNIGSPIKVSVETFYVEAQSQPEKDTYVFAYTITILIYSFVRTVPSLCCNPDGGMTST